MQKSWFDGSTATWSRAAAAGLLGGALFAGCTVADIRQNVFSGALGFVEDYTAGLLAELFPSPEEIVQRDGAAEGG